MHPSEWLTPAMLLALAGLVWRGFERIGGRIDRLETRFDRAESKTDSRFDKVDARFDKVDDRFGRLDAKIDVISERLQTVAVDVAVLKERDRRNDIPPKATNG
jgi:hypothetical protein